MGEHELAAAGREPAAAPRRLSETDKRVVGAFMQLRTKDLNGVIEDILAGVLDPDERHELALIFATIAADLEPPVVEALPPARWPAAHRNSGPPR